jgi:hypothetical protein
VQSIVVIDSSNVKTKKAQELLHNIMNLSGNNPDQEIVFYEFLANEVVGKLEFRDHKKYVIFYHSPNSLQNFESLNDLKNIIGFVDLGLTDKICTKNLERILNANSVEDFVKIGEALNELIRNSVTELQRVRKIHEKLVPLRESDLKGVHLSAKFAAGESAGGEFFDYVKIGQELIFVASSTNSYVITSLVLNNFERLKNKKEFSLENFVNSLHQDLRGSGFNLASGSKDKLELLLFRLDLKKLTMSGNMFGDFRFHLIRVLLKNRVLKLISIEKTNWLFLLQVCLKIQKNI